MNKYYEIQMIRRLCGSFGTEPQVEVVIYL